MPTARQHCGHTWPALLVSDHEQSRAAVWRAVDELTMPTNTKVEQDDNSSTWVEIPSLWRQAIIALYGQGEPGNGGNSVAARERSVMDLDLLEVCQLIRRTVTTELVARSEPLPRTVSAAMRRLASVVTAADPADLWWWEHRFGSWARLLATHLHTGDRRPAPVRLRNTACPECGERRVAVDTQEGPQLLPALVIEFAGGLVQAARCDSCGFTWWRGAALEYLASLVA